MEKREEGGKSGNGGGIGGGCGELCGVMVFVVEQNERAEKAVAVEAEMVGGGGG